ncbi:MAG: ABC transporter permease [Saccharofermentanales bacterium]
MEKQKKQSQFKEVWRRLKKSKPAMFGLIVLSLLILTALFAEQIIPYKKALEMNAAIRLKPPSLEHIFGTDAYGRDLFARVLHGGRRSLLIGFGATAGALFFGWIIASIVSYYGTRVDNLLMRLMDIIAAVPMTLMALAVVSALGPTLQNLIIAIAFARIPTFARIIRSSMLSVVDAEYIEAAHAGGAGALRIILKHITPNVSGTMIVQTTMATAQLILIAASLSFLGLGVQLPTPEWGALLSEAREFMRTTPLLMVFPGIFMVLTSLSLNLLGDGLRDALDPKLKS